MQLNQLKLIIANEYTTEVRSKSFWITTILLPLVFIGFGVFIALLADGSDSMMAFSKATQATDAEDLSGMQVMGMMLGMFLTLFLMMYGAQIFNKVKVEKSNRIVEILATCVDGQTMMLAKVIAVGLVGLTQLLIWALLMGLFIGGIFVVFQPDIPFSALLDKRVLLGLLWSVLFFIGGYVFYGSMYAACGAMSDRDNENQSYMTILTFVLLASFYLSQFAVDNGNNSFVTILCYIPFTSPSVATVNAITGVSPLWMSLLELIALYAFSWLTLALSGKLYKSSLLLKGRKISPADIITFIKAK